MPMGRRSSLASPEEVTRLKRSISDATSLSYRPGDKAAFALHDVDASSVQRAKLIRDIDEERFRRFRNFFKSYEPEMAREIQGRSSYSREQLNAWVNYIVSPKVLRCIRKNKDNTLQLLELMMVSAAIAKYGESELMAKDRRGDLEALQNIKFHTYDEYSRARQPESRAQRATSASQDGGRVGMDFVVRVNERLPQERRVGGVVLREILAHASTMQINREEANQMGDVQTDEDERLVQIVLRVQSRWFQDAMLKSNGRFLYDAIRQILGNVNKSLWDASKDKEELRRVRIQRSDRLGAAVQSVTDSTPPRSETATRVATMTRDNAPLVQSPINSAAKAGLSVGGQPPVREQEAQEKEVLVVGTDKTRRKLRPLGTVPRVQRSHGLPLHPTKRPIQKREPGIDVSAAAACVKVQEQDPRRV